MTSTSPPAYPAEYYYPEFNENRSDNPTQPSLSTATTNRKQLTNQKKKGTKNLGIDVVTDQGLPEADITATVKTDPKKSLIRDPTEKNIPRLIVNENIIHQAIHSLTVAVTNLDHNHENIESKKTSNEDSTYKTKEQTKPFEYIKKQQPHQVVKFVEDKQPVNEYWKREVLINDDGVVAIEPITYDKNTYEGPFGLTRKGSFVYYIGLSIFTLLAAVFLIMTGVFYSQNYPDSSSNTGELAGIGVCGLSFYLGFQLILIGIWHQKYRQENPIKRIKKQSMSHNESKDYLKSSMENNEQYNNYSYQQPIDYTPYAYYSNPPYGSYTNEQMLLQQPGAATGAGHYDSVVWPSNVEIETQPDTKFTQPMEWTLGPPQQRQTSPTRISTSMPHKMDKGKHKPTKSVEAQAPIVEFDNLHLNSNVIEQPLPVLSKAPETNELLKSIAEMEQNTKKSPANSDVSSKRHNRIQPVDNKTDVSSSNDNHHHHRHHHHRPRHHHHHHRHRYHSPSSSSEYSYYAHAFHDDHRFAHYHEPHPKPYPRIITPRFPKIITPSLPKIHTTIYRDTGINTGNETKLMRDEGVTADFEDVPIPHDKRFENLPIVRRTIIVEPYPAEPSSQIIVKPRADMIGKIRLGKMTKLNGDDGTIIYPSTAFMRKKSKKKKKATVVNNNIIEDLQLEDINDNNNDDDSLSKQIKNSTTSTRKTIKNAFYN